MRPWMPNLAEPGAGIAGDSTQSVLYNILNNVPIPRIVNPEATRAAVNTAPQLFPNFIRERAIDTVGTAGLATAGALGVHSLLKDK